MATGFAVGLSHLSRCHVSRLYVFWQLTLVTAVTLMPQASVTAESLLQSGIDNCCHVCHAVTHYQFCHWAYCCLYLHLKWANPGRKSGIFRAVRRSKQAGNYYPTHISKAAQSAFFVRSAPRGEGGRSRYGHPRMGVKVRCFINYFCFPFMQQYYQACFCLAFRQNIYSP